MKQGIPCFDYREIGPKGQNRIDFYFVTEGRDFRSSCSVSLGDTDPVTGEVIRDAGIFREYHRLRNREVYGNKKAVSVPLSDREREARREERDRIAAEFRRNYGYAPDRESLDWLLNEKMPKQYRVEIDGCRKEDGDPWTDRVMSFADPAAEAAFRAVEEEGHSLDDFMAQFTGRRRDVLEMLLMKSDGKCVHGMGKALAEKWHVSPARISQDCLAVGATLLKWLREKEE